MKLYKTSDVVEKTVAYLLILRTVAIRL